MDSSKLLLRCLADRNEFGWQAFCLDFDLAAQGPTFEAARDRLNAMIVEYVHDALVGEDREHADLLLRRRAPFSLWARYYWYRLLLVVHHTANGLRRSFVEPIPMQPAGC